MITQEVLNENAERFNKIMAHLDEMAGTPALSGAVLLLLAASSLNDEDFETWSNATADCTDEELIHLEALLDESMERLTLAGIAVE